MKTLVKFFNKLFRTSNKFEQVNATKSVKDLEKFLFNKNVLNNRKDCHGTSKRYLENNDYDQNLGVIILSLCDDIPAHTLVIDLQTMEVKSDIYFNMKNGIEYIKEENGKIYLKYNKDVLKYKIEKLIMGHGLELRKSYLIDKINNPKIILI